MAAIQGLLRPIDSERIAKQLNIVKQASTRGKVNLPAASEINLDVVEQSIVQKLISEWSYQRDAVIQQLKAYHDRLGILIGEAEISKIKIDANATIAKMRQVTKEAFGEFFHLVQDEQSLFRELNDFKIKHKLDRTADLKTNKTFTIGFMILLVALESILNGFFFAKGSELGILGGVGTAVGISIVNVLIAFLTGLIGLRFINYKSWLVKFAALFFSMTFIVSIITLHFFAAHLREATGNITKVTLVNLDRLAFKQAIFEFLKEPFILQEINSWYLFAFGSLMAFFAIYKGYKFDDPYPFYGNLTRRYRDSSEMVQDRRIDVFGDLEMERDAIVEKLKLTVSELPNNLIQANAARSSRQALIANFEQYEINIEYAINHLLRIYRDENLSKRTSPAPEYFSRNFTLATKFTELSEVRALIGDPEGLIAGDGRAELKGLEILANEVIAAYDILLDQTVKNPSKEVLKNVEA